MKRLTTPFGFHSTAIEVIAGIDLTGKNAIVTGGASGIGFETTRALATAGASVIVAVRRPREATLKLLSVADRHPEVLLAGE